MSLRTYINGNEWLGNNVFPDVIKNELVRQGLKLDENDCSIEPFEVKDLDGLVKATEQYIMDLYAEDKDIADFRDDVELSIYRETKDGSVGILTFDCLRLQQYAYIFDSACLLNYIGNIHKQWDIDYDFSKHKVRLKYKLINDGKCVFEIW